jgi:hypothetical protein
MPIKAFQTVKSQSLLYALLPLLLRPPRNPLHSRPRKRGPTLLLKEGGIRKPSGRGAGEYERPGGCLE